MHELVQFFHYYFAPVGQPWWEGNVYGNLVASALLSGGIIYGFYRKVNCAQKGCWRIGRHPVEGTHYKTCPKHTTEFYHLELQKHHKVKYPEAHAFLAKKAGN